MQPPPQIATSPPPRVFNYSLDWRFLLPVADLDKGRLLFDENVDFTQTLEQAGMRASQRLFASDIRGRKDDSFPFLAMPFGLSAGWAGARDKDRVEFYFSARRFIDPGGYLLVGFNNILNWRANPRTKYRSSTPRRILSELTRAGFKSVNIFGAIPDLQIPEYIFELESHPIQFALQNRFRRKPAVLKALRVLAGTVGLRRLSHFLPCYFAVATA